MDLGIIGLERAGKTTLFHALTRGHAHAAAHGTLEPSVGVVKIPDVRLDELCAILKPRKVTHVEARFLDFPGAFTAKGEGPAGAYLASLAQCDALVHVVRAFHDESVPHPAGSVDVDRDVGAVDLELAFADLGTLGRRHERLETAVRSARPGEREAGERELALVQRLSEALEREQPLRAQDLSSEERRLLAGFQLLTDKPLLIVVNIDEADAPRAAEIEAELAARRPGRGVRVGALCAKLEHELGELSDEEAAEFRADLGLRESGRERLLKLSQEALGLIGFFTVGDKEGRAWALPAGSTALEAAGRIHTDMARGFIRAEVLSWRELLDCGSYAEARRRGLLRTEGKQYTVQDGDVLHILFNV
jgi:hypothetical protein